jgi:hypothetical protein
LSHKEINLYIIKLELICLLYLICVFGIFKRNQLGLVKIILFYCNWLGGMKQENDANEKYFYKLVSLLFLLITQSQATDLIYLLRKDVTK